MTEYDPSAMSATFNELSYANEFTNPQVAARWVETAGNVAREWLYELPERIAQYGQYLRLENIEPLQGGTVSTVVAAEFFGTPVVLKLLPPWHHTSLKDEVQALSTWRGECAPLVLYSDSNYRSVLMERVMPGVLSKPLSLYDVAGIITSYSDYESGNLPLLEYALDYRFWRALENRNNLITAPLWRSAYEAGKLLANDSQGSFGLVHGDLRTKNVLQHESGEYVVIDPDPAKGDISYDAALWCIERPEDIDERCTIISEYLGLNPTRTRMWAHVLSVPEIALASEGRAIAMIDYLHEATKEYRSIMDYFATAYHR